MYPHHQIVPDVILVVGGTRKLTWLRSNKRRGVPIIHRLDGLAWTHRHTKQSWGVKLRAECINLLVRHIRNRLAKSVIYQSEFIRNSWHQYSGPIAVDEHIIYNATNCEQFKPSGESGPRRLVCVEGAIVPSDAYIKPVEVLSRRLHQKGLIAGTVVCGKLDDVEYLNRLTSCPNLTYKGLVPRNEIHQILPNSLFLVLEVNPPCPNSVIEALACGAPVVGYDTGALSELVTQSSGIVVPYRGDPWKLDTPDIDVLAAAAEQILKSWTIYSENARQRAIDKFDVSKMASSYESILRKYIACSA